MSTKKFRVWDISKKIWVSSGLIMFNLGFMITHKNYHVQQYTGQKDKNKKEVFEGDILKVTFEDGYQSYITKVQGANNAFVVDVRECDYDVTSLCWIYEAMPDAELEVIGNIYENPELVNK